MRHILKNNHGQTFIENVLAMLLLVSVFYMIVSGSVQLFKADGNTGKSTSEYQVVSQIIETIKGEPAVYQKNFNVNSGTSQTYLSSFPYGYGGSILYTGSNGNVPQCDPQNPSATVQMVGSTLPTTSYCDGFITYTIQPTTSLSGMFTGTIRVVHVKKDPREPDPQDNYYYFLVNTN